MPGAVEDGRHRVTDFTVKARAQISATQMNRVRAHAHGIGCFVAIDVLRRCTGLAINTAMTNNTALRSLRVATQTGHADVASAIISAVTLLALFKIPAAVSNE